jgi:hypothetical protein
MAVSSRDGGHGRSGRPSGDGLSVSLLSFQHCELFAWVGFEPRSS